MKKILFALPIVILLAAGCNSAQQSTTNNPSSQPQSQQTGEDISKNADKAFLLQATQKTDKPETPGQQAQDVINQAWEKFYKADYEGSMADFKRAYAIDVKSPNPNVPEFYLTLGIILGNRKDYDGSITILSKGVAANPQNTRTICTLAYAYENKYVDNPVQNLAFLDKATSYFQQADKINPNDANCQYFWSFTEYYKGNYAESWKHVVRLEKLGGIMDANFLQDLSKKMPRPQ